MNVNKTRSQWFLSRENDIGGWGITDGRTFTPLSDAHPEEISIALRGSIELALGEDGRTQRLNAWDRIAKHPFFEECYASEEPLIDSMMEKLDAQETASQTRVVDNIRDLAGLPRNTIVQLSDATVVQLGDGLYWGFGEDEPGPIAWLVDHLPATVLYTPPAIGEENS